MKVSPLAGGKRIAGSEAYGHELPFLWSSPDKPCEGRKDLLVLLYAGCQGGVDLVCKGDHPGWVERIDVLGVHLQIQLDGGVAPGLAREEGGQAAPLLSTT